jgi:membrane protein DedA with SNARE-associated domain
VFFGRSVSYLRVLTALVAGVSNMHYPRFLAFNAAGGIAWAVVFGLAGYTFGRNLGMLRTYIHEFAVGLLVIITVGIVVYIIGKRVGWFTRTL